MVKISLRLAGSGVLRCRIGAKRNGKLEALVEIEALDAERVRRDVDQHRADVDAGDDGGLDAGPHGDAQIGIDLLMRRLAEPLFEHLDHHRRARAAADEHHLVDGRAGQLAIVEGLLHAVHGPQQQRPNQLLVFGPG